MAVGLNGPDLTYIRDNACKHGAYLVGQAESFHHIIAQRPDSGPMKGHILTQRLNPERPYHRYPVTTEQLGRAKYGEIVDQAIPQQRAGEHPASFGQKTCDAALRKLAEEIGGD